VSGVHGLPAGSGLGQSLVYGLWASCSDRASRHGRGEARSAGRNLGSACSWADPAMLVRRPGGE